MVKSERDSSHPKIVKLGLWIQGIWIREGSKGVMGINLQYGSFLMLQKNLLVAMGGINYKSVLLL